MRICLTLPTTKTMNAASFTLPYGLAVLAPLLRKMHTGSKLFYSDVEEEILSADMICASGLSEAWGMLNELGSKAVALGKRFIVGGQHVTALPQTLKYGEAFRGPLENFDKAWSNPLPDWSIFEQKPKGDYVVMSSRGCPFKCRFCSSSSFWGGYCALPVNRVIEEIRQLVTMKAGSINLFDDLFTADVSRLRGIAERIVSNGLANITYSCLVRADSISHEVMELLLKMNIKHVAFGAESGSNLILRLMNKKTTRQKNQYCINMLVGYGFRPTFSLVLGFPGESLDTLKETKDFIEENQDLCGIEIYPVQPLPGTWLWEYFTRKYKPDLDVFDWSSLAIRGNAADWSTYHLLSDDCSVDDIRELCEFNVNKHLQ